MLGWIDMTEKIDKEQRIYKKGTKIRLHSSCNYAGCEDSEVIVLDEDTPEYSLNERAYEYSLDIIQPESWFEVEEDDDKP